MVDRKGERRRDHEQKRWTYRNKNTLYVLGVGASGPREKRDWAGLESGRGWELRGMGWEDAVFSATRMGAGQREGLGLCFSELSVSPPFTSPGAEPPRLPAPNLRAEASAKSCRELCLWKRDLAAAPFLLAGHGP